MAGGRKELLLLAALTLGFFAAMAAAGRPEPSSQSSAAQGLARALGVAGGTNQVCCSVCLCPMIWPPEAAFCVCGGLFDFCPDFCEGGCLYEGDGYRCARPVSYKTCTANQCNRFASPDHAAGEEE